MPGSGDSIQAIKAGLMEIPDVLVINKADRPGADLLRAELEATLSLVPAGPWRPPIVQHPGDRRGRASPSSGRRSSATARSWPSEGRLRERRREGLRRQLRALALDRLGARAGRRGEPAFLDGLDRARCSTATIDPATAVDRSSPLGSGVHAPPGRLLAGGQSSARRVTQAHARSRCRAVAHRGAGDVEVAPRARPR